MGLFSKAAKAMNIGRRMSDRELTQAGSKNSAAVTKKGLTNKNDNLPSLRADVMKDQKSDIDIMTGKGKKESTRELIVATREAAEKRAMNRTAGRAGAVAGSGAAGYGVGSAAMKMVEEDEQQPASSKKEESKEPSSKDERVNKEDYPEYSKNTKSASTFRESFKEAKDAGKDSFTFEGRKYTTEDGGPKKLAKGGAVMKANCGASVPPSQKFKK